MAQHSTNGSSSIAPTQLKNMDGSEHIAGFWQRYEHIKAQDIFKNVLFEVSRCRLLPVYGLFPSLFTS